MIRRSLAATFLALSLPVLMAQSKAAPPEAATQPAEPIKLYLMDGSVLAGRLTAKSIDVQTRYGALKIPLADIKSFTPGLDAHPELMARISAAIDDLGADGFPEREKATQALQKMGAEIRGELERAVKGAEGEKLSRLQKLIDELDTQKAALDEDDAPAPWVRQDIVATSDFTLAGKITTSTFDVVSSYGSLTVKLSDLRQVKRDSTTPEELRKSINVAGALIPQRGFENSGIRLAKGDVVTITASGNITMTPWGNATCSPDGSSNYGSMQPGNIPTGSLIAKLNPSGQIFKVGSKYTYTADRPGVLHFGVAVPGDYTSYQFPGEYNVKIKVTRKQ